MNATMLEAAATALGKIGKPSWKSATWWIGAAATVWGCVIAAGIIGPATPLAICVGGGLALGSVVAAHLKDGWVKVAIAAAPDVWELVKHLRAATAAGPATLAAHLPDVSPSLRVAQTMPAVSKVPGAVPEAIDEEDPR